MAATTEITAPEITREGADNARRDQLIVENLHLVHMIAGRVQRSIAVHTEFDDLVHAGTIGLFDAAAKYRDDKEVPFAVYAKHRIRGAILDSLRQIDWASRDSRRLYRRIQEVTRELSNQLHRTPTQSEVAEVMGLDERRWNALMVDFRMLGFSAAREAAPDSEERPVREVPSKPADAPDHVFARTQMRHHLNSALDYLPKRHKQVVKMYYEADMTMKEIGVTLGVNESRVSQIHKSALAKMQIVLGGAGISSSAALA